MPSKRNINQLADLKDKLGKARSVVFADYAGLTVGQQTVLRAKVAEAGGEFTVAKNTLLKLALSQVNSEQLTVNSLLIGPTAVLFSYRDEVMPLKVMVEFAKGAEKPTVKGGFLGNQELSAEQVLELARLPSKNELLVRLLGRMQSPIYGLRNVMEGNITKLVLALKARGNTL